MNPYNSGFNPWEGFREGYDLGDAMTATAERERQRLIAEKERAALAQMGQGGYLLGNEGNPKAVRAPWLSQLYSDAPYQALKVDQLMGVPLSDERKEGLAAKLASDKFKEKMNAFAPLVAQAMGMAGGQGPKAQPASEGGAVQPVNAFAANGAPMAIGSNYEGMDVPGGNVMNPRNAGSTEALLSGRTLAGAPTMGVDLDINPEHGPTIKLRPMTEFERQERMAKIAQAGRETELHGQKTADELRVTAETSRKQADEQVYGLQKEIADIKERIDAGRINPKAGMQRINELNAELKSAKARRDSVYFGKDAPAPQTAELTPEEKAKAAAVRAGKPSTRQGAISQPTPPEAAQADDSQDIGAGLPYQQQVALKQEKQKGDIEQTRKIITDANIAADQAFRHKQATDRMMELAKEGIGMRSLKIPGADLAATIISPRYDEMKQWRGSMITAEKQEGESQMYNTLPELKIQSSELPDTDKDENFNRRSIVSVSNRVDARLLAPKFLQQWSDQHGGSLKGAREELRSWMQHSPKYRAVQTKGGDVTIQENDHYIPLDTWTRLRQRFSEKEILAKQKSGGIQVINGRVFFKE